MLDPRIYRTGLIVVAVAVVVVAFSLDNQAAPLNATLTPDAFNGGTAYATMASLAAQYPDRAPGSRADTDIANYIQQSFEQAGLQVQRTASGRLRRLERLTLARRSHNWKQSSAGRAARWLRSTPGKPTVAASHLRQCTRLRTRSELLLSHLSARCDNLSEKTNNNNAIF